MDNDRNFIKRIVLAAGIVAVVLSIAAGVAWINIDSIYENRIASLAAAGKVDSANARYEELKMILAEALDAETRQRCEYSIADGMFRVGRYEEAQFIFNGLGEYEDSAQRVKECAYEWASELYETGEYRRAADMFLSLGRYSDSPFRQKSCVAAEAEELYLAGEFSDAIAMYVELGDHPGAADRAYAIAFEVTGDSGRAEQMVSGDVSPEKLEIIVRLDLIRQDLPKGKIAAGRSHSVAVREDGTVLAAGDNSFGQCDVQNWRNIVAVSAGAYFTIGLRADGTVVAVGDNSCGQCDVAKWTNVKSIAAGDYDTLAVAKDGTVLFCGSHNYTDTLSANDAVEVFAGAYQGACRLEDGSLITSNLSSATSQEPVSVALAPALAVHLLADGTLSSKFDRIPQWEDIIAVAANSRGIVGVTSEGKVRSFFFRESDTVEFDTGDDRIVAVSAGGGHYLLLDAEGKVYAFGDNSSGQCDVQDWNL